jgi:hypothetical protein
MRKSVIAGLALWAAFAAFSGKAHADVNYPWCIIGNTRAVDCYFSSREQCAQDGRNRGFGGQCILNPFYKPGAPTVSGKKQTETARPSQALSAGQSSTCTGLKLLCLSGRGLSTCYGSAATGFGCGSCDWGWEQCMKTGWWAGRHQAERR